MQLNFGESFMKIILCPEFIKDTPKLFEKVRMNAFY